MDLKEFIQGYIECAFWSSDGDDIELDENYTIDDISSEAMKEITEECTDFIMDNFCLLQKSGLSADYAGHNFWLTRNGHGSGFWDRGLDDIGDELAENARVYSSCYLFVDDNNQISIHK